MKNTHSIIQETYLNQNNIKTTKSPKSLWECAVAVNLFHYLILSHTETGNMDWTVTEWNQHSSAFSVKSKKKQVSSSQVKTYPTHHRPNLYLPDCLLAPVIRAYKRTSAQINQSSAFNRPLNQNRCVVSSRWFSDQHISHHYWKRRVRLLINSCHISSNQFSFDYNTSLTLCENGGGAEICVNLWVYFLYCRRLL